MDGTLTRNEILTWLREENPERLKELWARADAARREGVGDAVHLRGLIEISNHCVRQCTYCGLRAGHTALKRYRMDAEEIVDCAKQAARFGYGTVVMQAGEDYGIKTDWLADVILRIKRETGLSVTLSLGERPEDDLRAWKAAGADRYLLRFETSDRALYDAIHPPLGSRVSDRFADLRRLQALGYEAGSGIMLGIPGQSFDSVADDIVAFGVLDLDMVGIGPYLAHPQTPLGKGEGPQKLPPGEQVPSNELMVYKAVALTRILCPTANLPATTALATMNRAKGREQALQRGANVVMPNMTPVKYRQQYEIYPGKACIAETAQCCAGCLRSRIESIGRFIGKGPGSRRRAEQACA